MPVDKLTDSALQLSRYGARRKGEGDFFKAMIVSFVPSNNQKS